MFIQYSILRSDNLKVVQRSLMQMIFGYDDSLVGPDLKIIIPPQCSSYKEPYGQCSGPPTLK